MSDYIKREDAIKEANTWSMFGNDNLESRLKRLPSADVVEVVRCKDCEHCEKRRTANSLTFANGVTAFMTIMASRQVRFFVPCGTAN